VRLFETLCLLPPDKNITSNVALFVRPEGNKLGNIGIVALNVALFVRLEGNKSLTDGFARPGKE